MSISTTPNLLIGLIASNSASKEVQANSAIVNLELALTNQLTHAMANSDYTLLDPSEARQNMVFVFTGAITANRKIILPAAQKLYIFSNQTSGGHSLVFEVETVLSSPPSFGAAVTLANVLTGSPPSVNTYKLCYCDGTNVVSVT
jgi:hypothetical protein